MIQMIEPKLELVSLKTLLATDFPTKEPLLEPWFYQGQSCMIWSASGVGKTFFSQTLALAMGGGGSVLGWRSPKPRKVLLIDGEMDLQELTERFRGLLSSVEGIDVEAAGKNVTVLSRQDQNPECKFPDLASLEG